MKIDNGKYDKFFEIYFIFYTIFYMIAILNNRKFVIFVKKFVNLV